MLRGRSSRMSDQDRNPIISVVSKVGKGVVKAVKGVGQLAVPFLEVYGSQVCLQCHTPVHPDYEFCSDACCLDYWMEFKAHCDRKAGHKTVCGYPGCSKACFVDKHSGRVHDYCNRTHANEHRALQDQSQKFGYSHHGNRHHGGNQSGNRFWWSQDKGPIKFYNRDDPYYEFTNFYKASIKMNGKEWPTSEHYFQAQKFVGTPYVEQIRHLSRPREAFDFTRDPRVSLWRRSDWEDVKECVMYCALLAKFTQHDDLRNLLLGTKERKLIEHSPYDSYWGDGGDGTGKNRLGTLLEKVRHELQCGQKGKKGASNFPSLNQGETVKEHPQSYSNFTPDRQEKEHNDAPPSAADPPTGPLHRDSSHSDSDDNMDTLPSQQPFVAPTAVAKHSTTQGGLSPSLLQHSQPPSSSESMGAVRPPPGFQPRSVIQPQNQLQGSPGPHQMPQPQPPVYPPIGAPTYPQFNIQQQLPPQQSSYPPNGASMQPQFNPQWPNFQPQSNVVTQPQQSAYPPNGASMQQQWNPQWPNLQPQSNVIPQPQHSAYPPNGTSIRHQFHAPPPRGLTNSQVPGDGQQPKPAYYDETPLTPTTNNQHGAAAPKMES